MGTPVLMEPPLKYGPSAVWALTRVCEDTACRASSDLHEWCNDLGAVSAVSSVKL